MQKKKWFSLILAGILSTTMLTGCGGDSSSSNSSSSGGEQASEQSTETASEEPVEIIWMISSAEPTNYDSVMEAVNEKLLADINMTLDLQHIAPGDYNSRMQMAMAGGDKWDLCFTSNWSNDYANAAGKGAYLGLTQDMLNENAPNLMATIPEKYWDAVKINDNIYAMINYQIMYNQHGVFFNKQAAEEQGIDVTQMTSIEAFDAALEKLHNAYPDKYAYRGGVLTAFEDDPIVSTIMDKQFLAYDPETQTISNTLYFDTFKENYEYAKQWKDKGYTPPDASTMQDEATAISQGQILSRYSRYKPGNDVNINTNYGSAGQEFVSAPTSNTKIVGTGSVLSTLTAVNVNSENPEKAIQLYDYIFGNADVANMLYFGLEDQDYTQSEDGIVRNPDGYAFNSAWMISNQFTAYRVQGEEEGQWEETQKGNEEAEIDVLFGFNPNRAPVETEMATCEAVFAEYNPILQYGLFDDYDATIAEMLDKLNAAGLEKVTAEMQAQLDEFLASK